jgi:CRP-like cAMP-binding protein
MFEEFRKYLELRMDLSEAGFKEIQKLLVLKKAAKHEILLKSGETCHKGYFVLKGCLRSYSIIYNKEFVMQFAPENWWIGDKNTLTKPEPALLNIDALEESWVLQFGYDFLDKMEKIAPESRYMMQDLQQNAYRAMQKRVINLLGVRAEERYTHFIKTYPGLANRVPLQMIASYLGVTPQTLSRVRSKIFVSGN